MVGDNAEVGEVVVMADVRVNLSQTSMRSMCRTNSYDSHDHEPVNNVIMCLIVCLLHVKYLQFHSCPSYFFRPFRSTFYPPHRSLDCWFPYGG